MEVYECDTHIHKRRGGKYNMETGERCSRCLNSCFAADMCVRERRRRKRRRRQAPAVLVVRASKREMSCVSSGDGGRGDAHVDVCTCVDMQVSYVWLITKVSSAALARKSVPGRQ